MSKHLLTAIGLLFFALGYGQTIPVEQILKTEAKFINLVDLQQPNTLYLNCHYASPVILNPKDVEKVKGLAITKVELVYTTHKEVMSFDQLKLNRNRLISLKNIYPELFENSLVEWAITGQTGCQSRAAGQDIFHGFLISYRPAFTEADTKTELAFIEEMLKGMGVEKTPADIKVEAEKTKPVIAATPAGTEKEVNNRLEEFLGLDAQPSFVGGEKARIQYITNNLVYPREAQRHEIQGIVTVSFMVSPNGSIESVSILKGLDESCNMEALRVVRNMPTWNPGIRNGKPVPIYYTMPIMFALETGKPNGLTYAAEPTIDTTGQHLKGKYIAEGPQRKRVVFSAIVDRDSAIYRVMERNKQWNNILVVADLTGSMASYTTQILGWFALSLKNEDKRIKCFTFFNDGDKTQDKHKRVGRTGGIYHSKANDFNAVKGMAFTTMGNGSGGDLQENNVEAILEGLQKCPDCNDIVLIADNYATPRDLELINKIGKPVHIILCGAHYGVNMEYLNFALQNGGSIHTAGEDLLNLNELKEEEEIEIGYLTFKKRNGNFVPILNR